MPETYVHRIGRTARAGAGGKAISFCSADELPLLRSIEKLIRRAIGVSPGGEVFDQTVPAKPPAQSRGRSRHGDNRAPRAGRAPRRGDAAPRQRAAANNSTSYRNRRGSKPA